MVQRASRMIRLIEGNVKCVVIEKIDLYRDFAADDYLSEAKNPYPFPPLHCIRVYSILIHTWKGEGES